MSTETIHEFWKSSLKSCGPALGQAEAKPSSTAWARPDPHPSHGPLQVSRDCHGYGKTRRFEVTGFAGTGTVVDFSTPRYRGYFMVILPQGEYNFIVLKLVFSHIESLFLHCVTP